MVTPGADVPSDQSHPSTAARRAALADERSRVLGRVVALRRDLGGLVDATAGANSDDEHDPEGATIAFERAQLLALLHHSERRVRELDGALGRLRDGTYGICTACLQPIPAGRLGARPDATACVPCATASGR